MAKSLSEWKQYLQQQRGKQQHLRDELRTSRAKLRELNHEALDIEEALTSAQLVAEQTQQELEYRVSELATLALRAIFVDPYELSVDFVTKRNKTEAEISFVRNEEKVEPLSSSGGGAVDVAAFALRVAMWTLRRPQTRPTLILDEPFRHLKGAEANKRAIQMVKEISDRLKLQVIMISDERATREDIEAGADKVFEVSIKKGVSMVNVI